MMPTTVFPYTHPMDGFAILVSYEIKIKAYLSSVVEGAVSATVPMLMLHVPAQGAVAEMPPPVNKAGRKTRMIRLKSVDQDNTDGMEQPLINFD